jgi:hypothetical protein
MSHGAAIAIDQRPLSIRRDHLSRIVVAKNAAGRLTSALELRRPSPTTRKPENRFSGRR